MWAITNVLRPEETSKHGYDESLNRYVVVHPLDDAPEEKVNTDALGPMAMTASVRWSLISLRAYLLLMFALVLYRVVLLPGGAATLEAGTVHWPAAAATLKPSITIRGCSPRVSACCNSVTIVRRSPGSSDT